jgi:hypothetical protein
MGNIENIEISYKNTLGDEIKFDRFGIFYLVAYEGFGSPENEIKSQSIYGQAGQRKQTSQLSYRDMAIKIAVKAESFKELKEKERKVINILNSQLAGTITIKIKDNLYSIDAEPLNGYNSDRNGKEPAATATLHFRALDPRWHDENVLNKSIVLGSNKKRLKFPLSIKPDFVFGELVSGEIVEIINNGDFSVGFELTILCNATTTNPKILNILTREYFQWVGTFEAGTVLYLSTVFGNKKTWYKEIGDISTTNAMSLRDLSSTFFALDNQKPNNIILEADSGQESMKADLSFVPLIIGV